MYLTIYGSQLFITSYFLYKSRKKALLPRTAVDRTQRENETSLAGCLRGRHEVKNLAAQTTIKRHGAWKIVQPLRNALGRSYIASWKVNVRP